MRKLVYDVGINDADYQVHPSVSGKQVMCPFYSSWKSMLARCYSEKYQERWPTYIGCSVCKDWLTFSNFKAWMEQQDWQGNQLDKDLLSSGNNQYSPESCVFISGSLNRLLLDSGAKRGAYPVGVYWNKARNKFRAKIKVNGKTKHLGCFTTPQAAHAAWQRAKQDLIYNVAVEQVDERLKAALLLRCDKLQYDLYNRLETLKL